MLRSLACHSQLGLVCPSLSLSSSTHRRQGFCVSTAATRRRRDSSRDSEEFHEEMRRLGKPYRGVSWDRHSRKFHARIHLAGKAKSLGYYKRPEEAAAAVDKARQQHPLPTRPAPVGSPADWESEEFHLERAREAARHRGVTWDRDRRKAIQSKFTGVAWDIRYGKWQAYKHVDNKTRHLGHFDDEYDAARAVRRFLDTHCDGWRNPTGIYLEEEDDAAA